MDVTAFDAGRELAEPLRDRGVRALGRGGAPEAPRAGGAGGFEARAFPDAAAALAEYERRRGPGLSDRD